MDRGVLHRLSTLFTHEIGRGDFSPLAVRSFLFANYAPIIFHIIIGTREIFELPDIDVMNTIVRTTPLAIGDSELFDVFYQETTNFLTDAPLEYGREAVSLYRQSFDTQ